MKWDVTFASSKRDAALEFTGSGQEVFDQIVRLAERRGYVFEIDGFTDQYDAYRIVNGRRRRWLTLMA